MKIKELSRNQRPREKMMLYGSEVMSDQELLAIIIKTGIKGKNANELAGIILSHFMNGLNDLSNASVKELLEISGIGEAKACQLVAVCELSRRLAMKSLDNSIKITSSKQIKEIYIPRLRREKKEHFLVLLLDTKGKIISEETVSIGDVSSSIVHPRETFRKAIKMSASAIILIHNHPSGDPTPSQQDIDITKRLIDVGLLIGIQVIDHIIVGDHQANSLKDLNII
ncbi:MAG: DNA repair protein RadC [Eubacteriales bacterium]|nr:DNA repair protein RadC [Eubacteriales bacterium]MDY3332778.1 DNA repair protein RadC [Gallibacter sp.]